ncbi:MAG: hypothetical protein IH860_04490 [Chloroflexi bacterium]|nr:hypothetical protein [Chloroflexota bacterium]
MEEEEKPEDDRLQDLAFLRERVTELEAAKKQNIRIERGLREGEEESLRQAQGLIGLSRRIRAIAFSFDAEAGFRLLYVGARGCSYRKSSALCTTADREEALRPGTFVSSY